MRLCEKRHRDFESFDKIELKVVPRYKTSEMSGDEWRTSVRVSFFFKDEKVHETSYSSMKYALLMLGHEWVTAQEPIPEKVIKIEEDACMQAGCSRKAVSKYLIKELYSERGEKLDPSDTTLSHYRQFCDLHLERGDCGLEDSDSNYEVIFIDARSK